MRKTTAIILSVTLFVNMIAGSTAAQDVTVGLTSEVSGDCSDITDEITGEYTDITTETTSEITGETSSETTDEIDDEYGIELTGINGAGEYTANVRTDIGAGPFTTYSSPYGKDWGSVNKGESVIVLEAEWSGNTKYYYIQYNTSKGYKRGYISSYYLQSNSEVPSKIKTVNYGNGVKDCKAKATIPLRIGNTIWFDESFGHTLVKGDAIRVLRNDGNWMFVEHNIGGKNLRGYVDFARIDFYKKGTDYLRLPSSDRYQAKANNKVYFTTSGSGTVYMTIYKAFLKQMNVWNDSNGIHDNFPVPWSFTETKNSSQANIRVISNTFSGDSTPPMGATSSERIGSGSYRCLISINADFDDIIDYNNPNLNMAISHELGHSLSLRDVNNNKDSTSYLFMLYPSVMDYLQIPNVKQR